MRVFLTGISGYLGGVFAARLAEMPEVDRITGLCRSTVPAAALPPKVKLIRMDVRDPAVAQAMAGHDAVIHTAFVVQWPSAMPAAVRDEINLNGTRNVAAAAVANGVRRFIHTSSIGAYDPALARGRDGIDEEFPLGRGDSPLYYWNSKAAAEKILAETIAGTGIVLTLLRMYYVIGPRNQATVSAFRASAAVFPGRDPRAQFLQEDDAAAAVVLALREDLPGAYNVVPDDAVRLSQVYRAVGVKPVTVPAWLARLVAYVRWRYLDSPIHPSWVAASLLDLTADNAKLKAAGWTPSQGSLAAIRTALGK